MIDDPVLKETLKAEINRSLAFTGEPEAVYDATFDFHQGVIKPLLFKLYIKLDYYDPDTTYEEDVQAYRNALTKILEKL